MHGRGRVFFPPSYNPSSSLQTVITINGSWGPTLRPEDSNYLRKRGKGSSIPVVSTDTSGHLTILNTPKQWLKNIHRDDRIDIFARYYGESVPVPLVNVRSRERKGDWGWCEGMSEGRRGELGGDDRREFSRRRYSSRWARRRDSV